MRLTLARRIRAYQKISYTITLRPCVVYMSLRSAQLSLQKWIKAAPPWPPSLRLSSPGADYDGTARDIPSRYLTP